MKITIKKKTLKKVGVIVLLLIATVIAISCTTNNSGVETMAGDIVVLETNQGNIEIELYSDKAPISVKNFLSYVNEGFYDGLIFHRVIKGFMVQGGGFDTDMNQKSTKDPIKNEADNGLKNEKYTLAMARTGVVDSATSQFFINTADNVFLDHGGRDFGYAVFGKVSAGTDVVDKIEAVATTVKGMPDVPVDNVVIAKAYVKK
jgi:cyclophilin family peptidyl-prolyl cis-trans isomerase